MTCTHETDLGAYVLDALEPDQHESVQRHVAGCPACQEELRSLSATVAWLGRLTAGSLAALEREDGAAGPPRRRRRVVTALAAGALAASVALGTGLALDRPGTPPVAAVVRGVDPATHVSASVAVTPGDSGTRLRLALTGAYPSGWCSLVARSRDGRSQAAATWVADPHGAAVVEGTTTIPADQLSELDVVTDTGEVLVSLPVPSHTT